MPVFRLRKGVIMSPQYNGNTNIQVNARYKRRNMYSPPYSGDTGIARALCNPDHGLKITSKDGFLPDCLDTDDAVDT